MAACDEFTTELVKAYPVGDSLVMAHVRGHRRARETGEVLDNDFVMAFRIEDSQVTAGCDLIDRSTEEFFVRLGASPST
ncbi:MAG: hypothetical protein HYU28_08720 [Actinobacteria bacterium]|nr:hypothetical protein [Actinomycetota bacterium]